MYTSLSKSPRLPLEYLKKKQKTNYSPPKKMMLTFQRDRREVNRSLIIKKSSDTKSTNYHSGKQWQAHVQHEKRRAKTENM